MTTTTSNSAMPVARLDVPITTKPPAAQRCRRAARRRPAEHRHRPQRRRRTAPIRSIETSRACGERAGRHATGSVLDCECGGQGLEQGGARREHGWTEIGWRLAGGWLVPSFGVTHLVRWILCPVGCGCAGCLSRTRTPGSVYPVARVYEGRGRRAQPQGSGARLRRLLSFRPTRQKTWYMVSHDHER